VANALIHQDFTITGAGPFIEIYSDRVEVTNPGNSLIEVDRMLDERRSRNEKLASRMRELGLCEERGGGLDKTLIEIEQRYLPAPEFNSSKDSMRVVLFGARTFAQMSKRERQRSCFYHCVLRWIAHDYMSNASLREIFATSRRISGCLCRDHRSGSSWANYACRPRSGKTKRAVCSLLGGMSEWLKIDELQKAIEQMHGGSAALAQSVPVREAFEGKPVWEGVVHVFDLAGHPTATRAYAWSSPVKGEHETTVFRGTASGAGG
jgi:hypothetical protein